MRIGPSVFGQRHIVLITNLGLAFMKESPCCLCAAKRFGADMPIVKGGINKDGFVNSKEKPDHIVFILRPGEIVGTEAFDESAAEKLIPHK